MDKREVWAILSTSETLLWILCGEHPGGRTGSVEGVGEAGWMLLTRKKVPCLFNFQ